MADKRQLFKIGVGYQVTPQLNLGAHYFHGKQTGSATGRFDGKANFVVAVADYAFSKRTDVYARVGRMDDLKFKDMAGNTVGSSKAESFGVGLRHKF